MFDPFAPETVRIAVANVCDGAGRVLLTWNQPWNAYTLPMTKIDCLRGENAQAAAYRVAAQTVRVPLHDAIGQPKGVVRFLQRSARDGVLRNYVFHVVPMVMTPRFETWFSPTASTFFCDIDQIESGEYRPLSPTVERILNELRRIAFESGLDGKTTLAS